MEAPSLSPRKPPREDLIAGVGGSILAHAVIFSLALIIPWLTPRRTFQVPFYSVNLVSMKDIGLGPAAGKGKAGPPAEGSKAQSPRKQSSSTHAKSAPLVPVKRLNLNDHVTRTESQVKKMEAPDIPKIAENSLHTASLDKSLEKLITKPKVPAATLPPLQGPKAEGGKSESSQGTGSKGAHADGHNDQKAGENAAGSSQAGSVKGSTEGTPGGAAGGAQIALARRLYYTAVYNAIRQQWSLPEFLKSQKLEAVLVLVLRRDGKVMDLQFEKRSGQPLFDESVERAVRKADPLPPFPEIYSPAKEEIELHFRPEDLG
jgi:colicin import membrane protein